MNESQRMSAEELEAIANSPEVQKGHEEGARAWEEMVRSQETPSEPSNDRRELIETLVAIILGPLFAFFVYGLVTWLLNGAIIYSHGAWFPCIWASYGACTIH